MRFYSLQKLLTVSMVVFLSLLSSSALAKDMQWKVIKLSGTAWLIQSGQEKTLLQKGQKIAVGDEIQTENNSRLLLKRSKETILVSPNTNLVISRKQNVTGKTLILQHAGEILLEVEKRNVKHFEVQTPHLSAVVKGTRFSVSVTPSQAQVSVDRGLVEVKDFQSGKISLLERLQAIKVFANGTFELNYNTGGLQYDAKLEAFNQAAETSTQQQSDLNNSRSQAPASRNNQAPTSHYQNSSESPGVMLEAIESFFSTIRNDFRNAGLNFDEVMLAFLFAFIIVLIVGLAKRFLG